MHETLTSQFCLPQHKSRRNRFCKIIWGFVFHDVFVLCPKRKKNRKTFFANPTLSGMSWARSKILSHPSGAFKHRVCPHWQKLFTPLTSSNIKCFNYICFHNYYVATCSVLARKNLPVCGETLINSFLILDAPEIVTERSWIHSGEGFEAQLVCIVHADPQPTVRRILQ